MSKNLKTVAQESNGKPKRDRKETIGYKMDVARKRYKRSLAREIKALESETDEQTKIDIANRIASLNEVIANSYMTKEKKYTITEKRFIEQSEYEKASVDKKNFRNDVVFKREINQASVGGVSSLTKEEVKIFYGYTKKYWYGKPHERWNEAIKEALKKKTIKDAWDYVFEQKEAIQALEEARKAQEKAKSDNDVSDGTNEERDEKGSPPYMKHVILDTNT